MKIIDEKGRLFGKINVIDFLVIFFLLWLLTPMFYFGYKLYAGNKKEEQKKVELDLKEKVLKQSQVDTHEKEFIEITLKFLLNKLEPKTLNLISVGDEEIDEEGEVIGEMVSLEKPEPVIYEINTGEDKNIFKEDPLLKKMFATLKIKAELKEDAIYYKNKQILLNLPIDFKTDKYQVEAIYVSSDEDIPTFKEKAKTETTLASANQLDDVTNRITIPEKEMDDKKIDKAETNLTLKKEVNDISNSRITTVENEINDKEKAVEETILASPKQLNNIIYNIVSMEKKMGDLNNNIVSMEKKIDDVNYRITTVEKKVNFILSSPKLRKLIGMKD